MSDESPDYPRGKPQAHTCYGDHLPDKQQAEHANYRRGMCKAADYTGTRIPRGHPVDYRLPNPTAEDFTQYITVLVSDIEKIQENLQKLEKDRKEAIDNMNTVALSLREVSAQLVIAKTRILKLEEN